MLAVMENQQPSGPSSTSKNDNVTSPDSNNKAQEFLATGRTGRRNALPNILQQQGVDTSDLPKQFENLTTRENKCEKRKDQPGPSNASS